MKKLNNFFKKILSFDIIKVFSLTSISTFIKMLAGFVSVKVVSVIIGPAGVALVGQLNNFSSILMTIANGGISSGITRNIAAYRDNEEDVKSIISTAVVITLTLSTACGIFLIFGAKFLSQKILQDSYYSFVFIIFGVTLVFYALNQVLLAIVNGFKEYKNYVKISIISSIAGLGISLFLVSVFGVNGALINAVTSQTFVFIITVTILNKLKLNFMSREYFFGHFSKPSMIALFKFSLMAYVGAFCAPISQLLIRSFVINTYGMISAGCWEGMNRLSGMYLSIITTSFGVYYMPRLAELKNSDDIKKEINIAYKVLIPCLLIIFPCIYIFRKFIVKILFSPDFSLMETLFFWQLLGDFLKIISWVLSYVMSAKAMMKSFIFTEIAASFVYVVLTYLFSYLGFGIQSVVIAYCVNYFIYLIEMYFIVWRGVCRKINP